MKITLIPTACALFLAFTATLSAGEKETVEKEFSLNPDGAIHVRNVNGSIHIEVWDRDAVEMTAVKEAKSKKRLEQLDIEIDSQPDRLSLKAVIPKSKGWFGFGDSSGSIRFQLKVPQGAVLKDVESVNGSVKITGVRGGIQASTVNGRLEVESASGQLKLDSVNGSITAEVPSMNGFAGLKAKTVNGRVRLHMPKDLSADLETGTVNGRVSVDFPLTVDSGEIKRKHIKGRIGSGGPKIQVDTVNGSVDIEQSK